MDSPPLDLASAESGTTSISGPSVIMHESERVLSTRYTRVNRSQSEVVYEFTKDRGYLHQYYMVRERMYTEVLGQKYFSGVEDENDRRSDILVARKGNFCVGGARFTIKSPRIRKFLPMESEEFTLEKMLPEMGLEQDKYGEVSRVAMLPEFGSGQYTQAIFNHMYRKAYASGIKNVFAVGNALQVRANRKHATSLGLEFRMLDHIKVPDRQTYEGMKMYLHMFTYDIAPEENEKARFANSVMA